MTPDWDKINERKRKEINLGMAKNGAIQLTKDIGKDYKQIVRLLFKLNEELDKELLGDKNGTQG